MWWHPGAYHHTVSAARVADHLPSTHAQQTIAHKLAGDGNTNKSLDDVLAFKQRIEATYAANTLAVINGRIRFEHEDLYIELKKLSGRMSAYAYRFVVIYWVSYLDEFEQACMEFL